MRTYFHVLVAVATFGGFACGGSVDEAFDLPGVTTDDAALTRSVGLAYKLYHNVPSSTAPEYVIDYIVPAKGVTGSMDIAVRHKCFLSGQLVHEWTSRLLWSGNGQTREGHWNTAVGLGQECTGIAIDLARGGAEVSSAVRYLVQ